MPLHATARRAIVALAALALLALVWTQFSAGHAGLGATAYGLDSAAPVTGSAPVLHNTHGRGWATTMCAMGALWLAILRRTRDTAAGPNRTPETPAPARFPSPLRI